MKLKVARTWATSVRGEKAANTGTPPIHSHWRYSWTNFFFSRSMTEQAQIAGCAQRSQLGRTNQSGIRERASSEDTICNTLRWWVGVLWLGNSRYLCWEEKQFLLKLSCYFMTMQQKHACSMSLKNWRYANHLKAIWSHSLPNNFWTFEVLLLCWHCRSIIQTARCGGSRSTWVPHAMVAFAWCPFTGVWSVLCHPCSEPLTSLTSLTSLAQSPCSSTSAPSSALSTGHSDPAWELCSAFHASPGHPAWNAPFPNEPWGLGPLKPSPEIYFKRKPCKNDHLLRNTVVSMGCL